MIKAETRLGKDGKKWIRAFIQPRLAVVEDAMKSVPGVIYSAKDNAWAIPYGYRSKFEELLGDFLIQWVDEEGKSNGGISEDSISSTPLVPGYSVEYGADREVLSSTGFKTSPWGEYQVKGFNLMVERDFLILADDPGLGKL